MASNLQFLLATHGIAHLPQIAAGLHQHDALAELWMSARNVTNLPAQKYRRAWIYHLALKPFYHLTGAGTVERAAQILFPVWQFWMRRQRPPPFDVAYGVTGFATELFDIAERAGAFKLLDATSSHPTSAYGFWQRECDLWCPGSRPTVARWIFARINRELDRADLILCPSTFVRDSMLYNGIPEAKCVLNPYGVEVPDFKPRVALPQKPRFICVGAIQLRKGQQYLLRAFEQVKKALPESELVLVGTPFPDFRLEWERWRGTFTHYQHIPRSQLTALLSESTAFVFPSNEEGFAKAIIEAMASRLPIIATHESGATTLVRDGVEGIIVRPRAIEQIAEAMIKLARDPETNQRMAQAAYERGTERNTWSDFAARTITLCREAIAKKRDGRD
jgi:glycosyltransferase involved in cell wall biosynthesis